MNALVSVSESLSLVRRASHFVPAGPAGELHVSDVSLSTVTLVQAFPSMVTTLVPGELLWKPDPVSVAPVPPSEVPLVGAVELRPGVA